MSETYGHVLPSQALRPEIYGAKQRLAVFTEIRLLKKLAGSDCRLIHGYISLRTDISRYAGRTWPAETSQPITARDDDVIDL